MKTKDLIAQLQKEDPAGEAEVCVGNEDIVYVGGRIPGYYDGTFFKIHLDDSLSTADNTYGIKSVEMGAGLTKLKLRTMSMKEGFLENPDAEWIANTYNDKRDREFINTVEYYRSIGRAVRRQMKKLREEFEAKKKAEKNSDTSTLPPTKAST